MTYRAGWLAVLLVLMLGACGGEAPAGAPAMPLAAAATTVASTALPVAAAYRKTCGMCHHTGVAGAPKLGDVADWKMRLAKGGIDTLYKHAIRGFSGEKGMMPAKGGNPGLTDDEVKAAVDYMLAASR